MSDYYLQLYDDEGNRVTEQCFGEKGLEIARDILEGELQLIEQEIDNGEYDKRVERTVVETLHEALNP